MRLENLVDDMIDVYEHHHEKMHINIRLKELC